MYRLHYIPAAKIVRRLFHIFIWALIRVQTVRNIAKKLSPDPTYEASCEQQPAAL